MDRKADYRRALKDPESVFGAPEEVLKHETFSKEQKIEILRRWEYDASELEVAEEEGMRNDTPSKLRDILLALDELTGGTEVSHTAPTKQGGG